MAVVLEATAVIKGRDETKEAFASVEERIKALSKLTGRLSRDSAAVDRSFGSVGAASRGFAGAARTADQFASAVGRVEATVTAAARAGRAVAEQLPVLVKFAGGARDMASAVRVLREQLDGLAGAASKLSVLREQLPILAGLRRAYAEATTASAALRREMAAAGGDAMAGRLEASQRAATAAGAAYREQGAFLAGLRSEIEGVIGPLRSLAEAEARVKAQAEAAGTALRSQGGAARQAGRLGGSGPAIGGGGRHGGRRSLARAVWDDAVPLEGPEVLTKTGEAVHEGATVEHERVRLRALGSTVSPEQREAVEKQALDLAARYPSVTQADVMHQSRNAISIVGNADDAMRIAEPMTRLRVIANAQHPGTDNEEEFDKLIKGLEIKGVTQNPKEFHDYMEGIAKGLNAFGDTVKPSQYYDMFKYGRQATPMLSQDFILGVAPSIAQRMGGSSFGKGVSAFNNAIVGNRLSSTSIESLLNIGMLHEDDIERKSNGDIKRVKFGHHVEDYGLAQTNPFEFMQRYLDHAAAHGMTDPAKVAELIGQTFGNQMAAQLALILATQRPAIEKDQRLAHGAQGLDSADAYAKNDPIAAANGLANELTTLAGVLTAPVMADAAKALSGLSQSIGQISSAAGAFTKEHPDLAKMLAGGGIAGAAGVGTWLTGKLFGNVTDFLRGAGGSADGLQAAATHLDEAAGALKAAAGRSAGPPPPGPAEEGKVAARAEEGAAASTPLMRRLFPAGTDAAMIEGGAGAAGLAFFAGLAALVKISADAQKPGGGGPWAPATPLTRDLDEARLADLKAERDRVEAEIERNRARSKNPDALPVVNFPLNDSLARLNGQIDALTKSLAGLPPPRRTGIPVTIGPDIPAFRPPAVGHIPMNLPVPAAPSTVEPAFTPPDVGHIPTPPAVPLPLPLPAAPSAQPVPVTVVGSRVDPATLPAPVPMLPPGMHHDWTLGQPGGFDVAPGVGPGFSPFPHHQGPAFTPATPRVDHDAGFSATIAALTSAVHDIAHMPDLAAALGNVKATIDGPITATATVTGQADVNVTVKVDASSQLLQVAAKADANAIRLASLERSLPGAGGRTNGSAGQSRVVADPGIGRSR